MAQLVLIAAESESTLELLRTVLEHAGYEVCTATTSAQALACLQKRPSVILLAVPLPDMPAPELFGLIKAHSRAPVLVLGNTTGQYDIPPTMLTRSDAYHHKPLKLRMLFRQLEALIGRAPAQRYRPQPSRSRDHAVRER